MDNIYSFMFGSDILMRSDYLIYSTALYGVREDDLKPLLGQNLYILCVRYEHGDTQFGFTESGKANENPFQIFKRGMREEIGCDINNNNKCWGCDVNYKVKGVQSSLYLTAMSNIRSIDSHKESKLPDTPKKVTGVIYGTYGNIQRLVSTMYGKDKQMSDNIIGLDFISVETAIKVVNKIYEEKRAGHFRTFRL